MKPFSQPSIESAKRLAGVAIVLAALALFNASCVSQPAPGPVAGAPVAEAATREASVAIEPELAAMYRPAPATLLSSRALDEPPLPPVPAGPPALASAPSDITVLSSLPPLQFSPVALPEPAVPVPAPVPAPLPAAKPASKPAAVPAAKPAAKAAASTAASPLASTAAGPTPVAAPEAPKPAVVLPSPPSSSARSVVAAPATPVAETRVETVRGERFELRFPGTGWIYLGDEAGQDGLRYETRRFEDTQAVFAMNPERVGEYLLRFQRQNPVDRSTEASLVRVVVADKTLPAIPADPASAPASTAAAPGSTVAAPGAAMPGPASAPPSSAAGPAEAAPAPASPVAASSSAPTVTDPAALLRLARDELEAKRIQSAIDALDRYLSLYPYGNDEVFYLYGLAYEQDTPFRDIKKAWDSYRRVRDEYPRSARWREAADRIAYLERHYFGLR